MVVPHESYARLFLRFLRFGLLAWGGPVAQIAMIRQELVEDEHWVSPERFNRALAVYQVLPGPEAHELCVYFGMIARGRLGGLLAGLGFMLPGLILMLALSWFYFAVGIDTPLFAAIFRGFQPAVAALIVRAVHRIGGHALSDRWLWAIALIVGIAELLGVSFWLSLAFAGLTYVFIKRGQYGVAALIGVAFVAGSILLLNSPATALATASPAAATGQPSLLNLFVSGLRGGLLTFGGAYTAIPFLQRDAVTIGGWMTSAQFLDGLALSGILPAPLIIFSTFIGYSGGGLPGALAITTGIFLPAFAFTLIGHDYVERLIENKALHTFLEGITAGVVGIIAATTLNLMRATLTDLPALVIFALALIALYRWKAKAAVAGVVLGAGLLGLLLRA